MVKEKRTDIFNKAEDFWNDILADEIIVHDFLTSNKSKTDYKKLNFRLDKEFESRIEKISKGNDLAIYMILLAIYDILLYRYTDITNNIVTSPVMEASGSVFNKFVLFRQQLKREDTFRKLLECVKPQVLGGYKHQFYPIRKIIEKRDENCRRCIMNFALVYNNIHNYEDMKTLLSSFENKIILSVTRENGTFDFCIEYKEEVMKHVEVSQFIEALQLITEQVLINPDIEISNIKIFTEEIEDKILKEFNHTDITWDGTTNIIKEFEAVAVGYPDNQCLSFLKKNGSEYKNTIMTYQQVNEKANQLGHFLRERGVKSNDIVALVMKSSLEMYIGILGILKAGAAYLPLSPKYPLERILFSLKDSNCNIILTNIQSFHIDDPNRQLVYMNKNTYSMYPIENLNIKIEDNDTAYVVYTSGTTGTPKGVLIDHGNVINTLLFRRKLHSLTSADVILQLNTYVFDGFVATFFTPLISGAKIIAIREDEITDIETLKEAIQNHGVTHFASIPMLYKEMVDTITSWEFASVKSVVLAGDKVGFDIIRDSQKKFINTKVIIEYGVSECSVLSTYFICDNEIVNKYLIGKPIANHTIYVLSWDGLLQPMGVVGELCISGVGVSNKGYINDPETSEQKFVRDPFVKDRVMYKTGDLVRWLGNGVLEYLGRQDNQVKIRGYRIELSEIEKQLIKHPSLQTVIVITKKLDILHGDSEQEQYICAYYLLNGERPEIGERELKQFLHGKVPEYMIPAFFQKIDHVPLTTNNKIDYDSLPPIDLKTKSGNNPLKTEIEKKLALIWANILNIKTEIIREDTAFFEFGGHSLNIMKLLSRINKEFKVNLSVAEVYKNNEFGQICAMIKANHQSSNSTILKTEKREYYPVSSAQKRMYFLQELDKTRQAYLITTIKKLEHAVDINRIQRTFQKLISIHEVLRTSFHHINGEIVQKIHDLSDASFTIQIIDGNTVDSNRLHTMKHHFDLSKPVLLAVDLVRYTDTLCYLVVNIHHIIADGYSVKQLLDEFMRAYKGEELQAEYLTYKDFAFWQIGNKVNLGKERDYWLNKFRQGIPALSLPADYVRPAIKSLRGNVFTFQPENTDITSLKQISDAHNVSIFMILLAVYNIFLHRITGNNEIVVGVPTSGRKIFEIQNMVGMFANTLPMKNTVDSRQSFRDFLLAVKDNCAADLDHENYQYEDMVSDLNIERKVNMNPLFDTMLNFEDIDMPSIEMDGVKVSSYEYPKDTSKFDLTLNCKNIQTEMVFEFEYDVELFKKETIAQYAIYVKNIIREICRDVTRPIYDIHMLSEEEYSYIHKDFNATKALYPVNQTVIDLFEEQAALHPDKIALNIENDVLTYAELSKKTNALANKLINTGAHEGEVFGVMIDKSFELIIAILSILKAGAVYIPMGNEYDARKIEHVMDNSAVRGMLVDHKRYHDNEFICQKTDMVLFVDDFISNEIQMYSDSYRHRGKPEGSAYIIYTSGSTGVSKGVEITNRNLMNYICWSANQYVDYEAKDFAFFTSISFDLTVTSIFTPLISGNTIVIYKKNDIVSNLKEIIAEKKVQIVKLTPSHLEFLVSMNCKKSAIKRLIVGGENLTGVLAQRVHEAFDPNVDIVNEYGPTEACVGCMLYHYTPGSDESEVSVPIGRPAANMKVYLLDQNRNIIPKGMKGELYLSGDSIAKGYINDSAQTTEKFVSNPFLPGVVMYKTGDLAVMNKTGDLVYAGRNDRQVKISGYRIELNEIEYHLLKSPGIRNAIAAASEINQIKYLMAFVVTANESITAEVIRESLRFRLPEYMIPEWIVVVDDIPVNESGKADIKGLQKTYEQFFKVQMQEDSLAARSDETAILQVWKTVLGKPEIGINENFFEAGGNSLKALRMKSMLEEVFRTEVNVTVVFEYPTIKLMSRYFNEIQNADKHEGHLAEDEMEEEFAFMSGNILKLVEDEYAEEEI